MSTLVYIPGVWDLLHVGHVTILESAKSLGDTLVVGVPSDAVVEEDKGEPPIIPLQSRYVMLAALGCVDLVVPYYELDFMDHVSRFNPDIFVVGDQWGISQRHLAVNHWADAAGKRIVRLPYFNGESTSNIKDRIRVRKPST